MTTDEAREAILGRVRASLVDAPAVPTVPRAYGMSLAAGTDLVELFAERVADYRADVRRATPATVAAVIAEILATAGARRVVVPSGIGDPWLAAGVEWVRDEPPLSHAALDAVDAVLTGSAVSIAETGTIVLDAGSGQGRRALSLLPDHHVCVVEVGSIVGTVAEALPRLDPRRPLTWISGPSATSDIELQRIEGVHGPRHLHVVILGG